MAAVKGSPNEKRLASQFIAKFFAKFPDHADTSLEAILDLCEDEDVTIRKQAIRDLPIICKESPDFVPKITDILAQLIVTDDPTELLMVNSSLLTLYRLQPKGFLTGLFSQIENGEEVTRERSIKFLTTKLRSIPEDAWNRELEELLIQMTRKAMVDCTKDEFIAFMSIISGLKISKLVSGQQLIVDIISEQIDMGSVDVMNDAESLDKLLMCVKYASPYFSPFVNANGYVNFFCHNLLPNLEALKNATAGVLDLEIVQLLAELMPNIQMNSTTHPIDIPSCQSLVYQQLRRHLPLPLEVPDPSHEESLQFTHIESLLFAFHQISKLIPDFITSDAERLKDLKIRLQYLARCVQTWQKKLRGTMNGSSSPELKVMALKTTANITAMVRDLFHSPPSFKSGNSIILSWKPAKQQIGVAKAVSGKTEEKAEPEKGESDVKSGTVISTKRKPVMAPEGSSVSDVKVRREVKPYAPPAGRFSTKDGGKLRQY